MGHKNGEGDGWDCPWGGETRSQAHKRIQASGLQREVTARANHIHAERRKDDVDAVWRDSYSEALKEFPPSRVAEKGITIERVDGESEFDALYRSFGGLEGLARTMQDGGVNPLLSKFYMMVLDRMVESSGVGKEKGGVDDRTKQIMKMLGKNKD